MSIALVPIKGLSAGKSRLHPRLSRDQLEALSLAMLEDIVEALLEATSVSRVAVVTPDGSVAQSAEQAGAEGWIMTEIGLNPSLEAATERVRQAGEASLVVLGDVAGIASADIDALQRDLDAQGGGVALAPSNDGGTSALLRDPANAIACCFGAESAKAHREAAEAGGVAFCEGRFESLALDLDQPEDLEAFLASQGGGRRTRALLERFKESSR